MKNLKLAVLFLSLMPLFVYGQDDEFSKDILKMQEINGSGANFNILYEQIVGQMKIQKGNAPDIIWASLKRDVFDVQIKELNHQLIPIYKKHFTHQEVKEIIKFYESAVGRKMADETPEIFSETMQLSQQWAMGLMAKMQAYLTKVGF